MRRARRRAIVGMCMAILAAGMTAGCAARRPRPVAAAAVVPPGLVLGEFVDDYGSRYTISVGEWFHHPAISYRIIEWNAEKQYAVAQNGPSNFRSAGLWTRLDWMPLTGMAPYEWAFCLSAYDAPSAEAAEAAEIANRDRPKTGCNGYPFSRMRRVPSGAEG